ncbi:MAG: hypothetical protein CMI03_07425, partial [Oceanospirillaceae bacterium]|nr:hypothetical protein [Oceanospirillaceae bacterium]
QKARSGEVARPARGVRPLYEDKGPDIFRKCLNRNLWGSSGTLSGFFYSALIMPPTDGLSGSNIR